MNAYTSRLCSAEGLTVTSYRWSNDRADEWASPGGARLLLSGGTALSGPTLDGFVLGAMEVGGPRVARVVARKRSS